MTDYEIFSIIIQTGLFIVGILTYVSNKKDYPSGKSK